MTESVGGTRDPNMASQLGVRDDVLSTRTHLMFNQISESLRPDTVKKPVGYRLIEDFLDNLDSAPEETREEIRNSWRNLFATDRRTMVRMYRLFRASDVMTRDDIRSVLGMPALPKRKRIVTLKSL